MLSIAKFQQTLFNLGENSYLKEFQFLLDFFIVISCSTFFSTEPFNHLKPFSTKFKLS